MCDRECRRCANVRDNTHVPIFDSRLGAHTRWLSCTVAWGRRVSDKGRCPARGGVMVTRGVLGFYAYAPLVTVSTARWTRQKGLRYRTRMIRPAVPICDISHRHIH